MQALSLGTPQLTYDDCPLWLSRAAPSSASALLAAASPASRVPAPPLPRLLHGPPPALSACGLLQAGQGSKAEPHAATHARKVALTIQS